MNENRLIFGLLGAATVCLVAFIALSLSDDEPSNHVSDPVVSGDRTAETPSSIENSPYDTNTQAPPSTTPTPTGTTRNHPIHSTRLSLDKARDVDLVQQARKSPDAPECRRATSYVSIGQDLGMELFRATRDGAPPIPWEREQRIGQSVHEEFTSPGGLFHRKIVNDSKTQRYLTTLFDEIRPFLINPHLQFQIFIVQDDEQNAIATVGGYIYIYTGLLAARNTQSEAALMYIIAHEIAHHDLRHTSWLADTLVDLYEAGDDDEAESLLIQFGSILTRSYSSKLEDEADKYAYDRVIQVGYSPFEAERWFWRMADVYGRPSSDNIFEYELNALFNSHSDSEVRACNIRRWAHDNPPPHRTYRGKENLKRRIPARSRVF